mmetsp:Transcript_94190/g.141138  ORF Transcript_94190/g.141138 Transcript_94190/m.141138 type:complete len:200 (-) Transcript_94190:72-671(-)
MHQTLDSRNSNNFAACQYRPSLGIRVIRRNGNDPVLWEEAGHVGDISRRFRSLLRGDHSHVMDHHSHDGFDGDDSVLPSRIDLNGNRIRASLGMLNGNTFVRDILHFLFGARIVKRQAHQSLHVLNGGFEGRNGARSGLFSHLAGGVESNHGWVQTVRVSIQDNVDASATCRGNYGVEKSNIYSNNTTHCRLMFVIIER